MGQDRAARGGRGSGAGVPSGAGLHRAGSGHQHQTKPALRPQLRVLFRGSLCRRRPGGELHRWRAEPGHRHEPQAFRRQQSGIIPHGRRCNRRHAYPDGDLSGGLRACRDEGPALDCHVLVQQAERHPCQRACLAARHGLAPRLELWRRRHQRLGRHERPGGRTSGGPGPGHAGQ